MAMTEVVCEILPEDKPRYLMVGGNSNKYFGKHTRVDMFDCVMPTRNARNGMLLANGTINIKIKNGRMIFFR
jgi:queuine tRNA-ribosyltransferase